MKRILASMAVFFLVLAPAFAEAPEAKKSIAWLQGLQQTDGAFPSSLKPTSSGTLPTSLRATSSAIRAIKYLGGEAQNKDKSARFVDAAFDKATGGFADTSGANADIATTAVGLMAVAALKMPQDKYVEPAVKFLTDNAKTFEEVRIAAAGLEAVGIRPAVADAWLDMVAKMKNTDGTWGKGDGQARDTGSTAVIVLRLGGKLDQSENVLKALKAGQRGDGGFGKADAKGSDLETTYRVMRAFHMLKDKPADVKALRDYILKHRNADGGYGPTPGEPSAISPTYFAAIIQMWLDEK